MGRSEAAAGFWAALGSLLLAGAVGCAGPATGQAPTSRPGVIASSSTSPDGRLPGSGARRVVPASDQDGARTVAGILFPTNGIACGADSPGGYSACPLTDRLAARLNSNPLRFAEPLCRCQNAYSSRTITVTPVRDGGIAHVALVFGTSTESIDINVLRTPAGWLADDTSCAGKGASTSIYAVSPPPCSGG